MDWRLFVTYRDGLMWRETSAWRSWVLATYNAETGNEPPLAPGVEVVKSEEAAVLALAAWAGGPSRRKKEDA